MYHHPHNLLIPQPGFGMTFDEELKRAFDTLSERLQEEVGDALQVRDRRHVR